jgi:antitoxin component HigA of HigAB toxin-antitoxin module
MKIQNEEEYFRIMRKVEKLMDSKDIINNKKLDTFVNAIIEYESKLFEEYNDEY